jgi:glc operon protein GlcG
LSFRKKRYNIGQSQSVAMTAEHHRFDGLEIQRGGKTMKASTAIAAILLTTAGMVGVSAQTNPPAATAQQPAPPPAPPFGWPITVEQAQKAAEAAMAKAREIGVPNAVAVVEPTGELVYFVKMDGAPYSAIQLAQQKAVAAARYRRPTKAFYDGIEGGHPFFLTFPNVAGAPGGVPIVIDGKLVGAIGVSGGNGDQDVQVSGAGAAAR